MMETSSELIRSGMGQRGMAMVSALLLLLVVSLLAVGLSMDSSMDVRISGYERATARANANSEAALVVATEILKENDSAAGSPDAQWLTNKTYPRLSARYNGAITILDPAFYSSPNMTDSPVMILTGDINAVITTQNLGAQPSRGGAIQIAAGYAGAGHGAASGGVNIAYDFQGAGTDSASSSAQATRYLGLSYRLVPKM